MTHRDAHIIAVVGATGLQGGSVTRALLEDHWTVRALTRDLQGKKARALAELGADLVKVDTADPATLGPAFQGAYGVFNVQNHHVSGYEGEVQQGRNVADAAKRAGVEHLVYGAAGLGTPGTGVGSWETKVEVARYMHEQDLPVTVLRPMAFMELMTESKFFPAASTWHTMPKLMGWERPVGWLAVDDLAGVVVTAFGDPGGFIGRDIALTSDVQTLDECRGIWREVVGRGPRRFPMPTWLFERFVGTDETTMWRWLRSNEIDLDPGPARAIRPNALSVREWLRRTRGAASGSKRQGRGAKGALTEGRTG